MLHAIKKTRIHEEVVTQIHDLIREGRLKAGDQLPSERELSETFKVSRTSVREALRHWKLKDLLSAGREWETCRLAYRILSPLGQTAHRRSRSDIFELRKLIEPHIAALAAERATRKTSRE